MVDKYVSVSTNETVTLKVQTGKHIQVNYEAWCNVHYRKFNLK